MRHPCASVLFISSLRVSASCLLCILSDIFFFFGLDFVLYALELFEMPTAYYIFLGIMVEARSLHAKNTNNTHT